MVDELRESVGNGAGKVASSTGTGARLTAGVVCLRCFNRGAMSFLIEVLIVN